MDIVDKMRKLLDEHGVKYEEQDHWTYDEFGINYADECGDYMRRIYIYGSCVVVEARYLAPEQAIELICEPTCRDTGLMNDDSRWYFVCSKCGCEFDYTDFACEFAKGYVLGSPHYCPNCGARVIE